MAKSQKRLGILPEIQRAARQIAVCLGRASRKLTANEVEAQVLWHVLTNGACSVRELQRFVEVKPSTLTSVLDRLAARGWIQRTIHPLDRRSFLVELTGPGRTTALEIDDFLSALEREVLKRVTKGDAQGVRAVAAAIDHMASRGRLERE